ncbi:MAG: hypothetical protein KQH63_03835 [Desulfobulbaceae bacterium]|nr:hypothetical protein [Desulfobulbaceae bacterium]
MLYYPELAVYVWLVPVFLCLIIPIMVFMARLVSDLTTFGMAYFRKSSTVPLGVRVVGGESSLEKRSHPRYCVPGIMADVSDGTHSCTGLVCNISRIGIGLMELPEKIMHEADRFSVIIKKQGSHYPMYLNPQWVDNTGPNLKIGGLIEHVPADWEDFVTRGLTAR